MYSRCKTKSIGVFSSVHSCIGVQSERVESGDGRIKGGKKARFVLTREGTLMQEREIGANGSLRVN